MITHIIANILSQTVNCLLIGVKKDSSDTLIMVHSLIGIDPPEDIHAVELSNVKIGG
jgi:hypothetical protein